jgi:hypothetical protein
MLQQTCIKNNPILILIWKLYLSEKAVFNCFDWLMFEFFLNLSCLPDVIKVIFFLQFNFKVWTKMHKQRCTSRGFKHKFYEHDPG